MAFPTRPQNERPKSMIFRNPVNADEYAQARNAPPLSPIRAPANNNPGPVAALDARNSLQRRFTTNALPSLAPIGEQRGQANEQGDPQQVYGRMSATEKKARQYEALLAQQRRIQAQMALIDPETRREVDEARKLEHDISLYTSGALAEPGTPPGPTSAHNQPSATFSNRFSASSITSPGYNSNRQSRTGSQLTSPPPEFANSYFANQANPSQSVPTSQRNSDHGESDDDYQQAYANAVNNSGANPNRNSVPVTALDHRKQNGAVSAFSPVVNPSHSFFGDDDGRKSKRSSQILTASSPDSKTFLTLHQTDDQFPILLRRGTDTSHFSGSVTPLEEEKSDRNGVVRQRQSLPPATIRHSLNFADTMSGLDGILSDATTAKHAAPNRHSLEANFGKSGETRRPTYLVSPIKNGLNGLGGPNKVTSSYSTNDIPTLKSISSPTHDSKQGSATHTPAEEKPSPLHNLGAKIAVDLQKPLPPYPPIRDQAPEPHIYRPQSSRYATVSQQNYSNGNTLSGFDAVGGAVPQQPGQVHNGFGGLNDAFGSLHLSGSQQQWQSHAQGYNNGSQTGYQQFGPGYGARYEQSNSRPQTGRRSTMQSDDTSRIANVPLEELVGEIYGLCKDQHGCRFLQKKLEERDPENIRLIFEETLPHVVELMTDPFGNYLCQKLLEYADDEQRTRLIQAASPFMVKIALNQHGTRALQKTIEFITKQEQIEMVIQSLKNEVVQLIQDLNGNHVIQKCLNHLKKENVQFIVDAVCVHVVTVGTHRHGCCVLQRCVDHASGLQKGQLVNSITQNVFALVQDPFGNYVVQYILDLGEPNFSEPLCRSMSGSVTALACQKFSSNVMEKGIRVASEDTRRILIQEMLHPGDLQRMLRDSFANYVVQTAMDYADDETKAALFDAIRPIMATIRHTPHGRRIQTKIHEYDGCTDGSSAPYPRAIASGMTQPSAYNHVPEGMGRAPFMQPHYSVAPSYVYNNNHNTHAVNHPASGAGFGYPNGPSRFPLYSSMSRSGHHNGHHF